MSIVNIHEFGDSVCLCACVCSPALTLAVLGEWHLHQFMLCVRGLHQLWGGEAVEKVHHDNNMSHVKGN